MQILAMTFSLAVLAMAVAAIAAMLISHGGRIVAALAGETGPMRNLRAAPLAAAPGGMALSGTFGGNPPVPGRSALEGHGGMALSGTFGANQRFSRQRLLPARPALALAA